MQHGQPYTTRRAVAGAGLGLAMLLGAVALASVGDGGDPTVIASGPSSTSSTKRPVNVGVASEESGAPTDAGVPGGGGGGDDDGSVTSTTARSSRTTATTRRSTTRVSTTSGDKNVVGNSTQSPVTAPGGQRTCHPSYDPCLQTGIGDYDCQGGDGPNFVQGTVKVTEPDEFGLDADHDGTGCDLTIDTTPPPTAPSSTTSTSTTVATSPIP